METSPAKKRKKHSDTRKKEKKTQKLGTLRDNVAVCASDCAPVHVQTIVSDSLSSSGNVSSRSPLVKHTSSSAAVDGTSWSVSGVSAESRPGNDPILPKCGTNKRRRNRFLIEMNNAVSGSSALIPKIDEVSADPYQELHQIWHPRSKAKDAITEELLKQCQRGKWTTSELTQLHYNVTVFMKTNNITDINENINGGGFKRIGFVHAAAKGINRSLRQVYMKTILFYNENHFGGKFTEEDDRELLGLQSKLGNKWAQIGLSIGRTGVTVARRYAYLKQKKSRGPWASDEVERLKRAVLTAFVTAQDTGGSCQDTGGSYQDTSSSCQDTGDNVDLCKRLQEFADLPLPESTTWEMIGKEVETRGKDQCRIKWFYQVCWIIRGGQGIWTLKDSIQLVGKLSQVDADSESLVDWPDLARNWLQAKSGPYLRQRWNEMTRFIPNSVLMDFPDMLDYVYEHMVPVWKTILEGGEDLFSSDL